MKKTISVSVRGREYMVARARLGRYLRLQAAQEKIDDAARKEDTGAIAEGIIEYIQTAQAEITRDELLAAPWYEVLSVYQKIEHLNRIPDAKRYAILRKIEERRGRSVPWHFVGRSAFVWIHIIASAYNWAKSEIENLWPEEAIAFIQEILVDEQLEREFLHSLSEVAYRFDKTTKKSRYVPMTRPPFMVVGTDRVVKKTRLHRQMLPQGNIVYPEDADDDIKT